jgi:hypothetical protein
LTLKSMLPCSNESQYMHISLAEVDLNQLGVYECLL